MEGWRVRTRWTFSAMDLAIADRLVRPVCIACQTREEEPPAHAKLKRWPELLKLEPDWRHCSQTPASRLGYHPCVRVEELKTSRTLPWVKYDATRHQNRMQDIDVRTSIHGDSLRILCFSRTPGSDMNDLRRPKTQRSSPPHTHPHPHPHPHPRAKTPAAATA